MKLLVPNPLEFESIEEFLEAFRTLNLGSGNTLRGIAKELRVSPGYLSGVFSGSLNFTPNKAISFAGLTNLPPPQRIWLLALAANENSKITLKWIRRASEDNMLASKTIRDHQSGGGVQLRRTRSNS